jgi:hypothetical protein
VAVFPAEYRAYVAAHPIAPSRAPDARPAVVAAAAPVVAPAPVVVPVVAPTVATAGLPMGTLPLGVVAALAAAAGVVTIVRWRNARRVPLAG